MKQFYLLVNRYVMANTTKLALEANTFLVVWRGVDRVVGCSALRARVVVIIRVITSAVVIPARGGIYQPRPVDLLDALGDGNLGVRGCIELAPALIVDDLVGFSKKTSL